MPLAVNPAVEKAAKSLRKANEEFIKACQEADSLLGNEVMQWYSARGQKKSTSNYKLTSGNIEQIVAAFDEQPTSFIVNQLAFYFAVSRTTIIYHLKKFNRIPAKGYRLPRK